MSHPQDTWIRFRSSKGCSHRMMQNRLAATTITIPVPDHKELRLGTLRSIIRQSGLPRKVFES
ncbi:MAG TPA: type II toxin-antitoxin system HicA family toxin [Tepidisphaeraceae bacterium]|nr:type II toxin-antitoxin system HicA family toxin [Tepidisphaeraceae bacterium]